ncbi:tlde1 domain-containing protein [Noviherbaspirillum aerium]|uniref:tlde1 domain-containing protein n=1 Tax=Noviherbaspirillum aerium TaxID=2588497 RepID=UPI00124DC0F8|nr:tlde1 domain-containing protein [Noviherbaspirillum aerium]
MVWQYSQRSGQLRRKNETWARGYSGKGAGKNNPGMEQVRNIGPIPRGHYRIGRPYQSESKGPHVMNLEPMGHIAHGRTLFRIHGDSRLNPGTASEGCIILPRHIRQQISASGDIDLVVVE